MSGLPIVSASGYLTWCRWGAHYVPADETTAREQAKLGQMLVCAAHLPLQVAHPELEVCGIPCGHNPSSRRQALPDDCPGCAEIETNGQRLSDTLTYVACPACGHTWTYPDQEA